MHTISNQKHFPVGIIRAERYTANPKIFAALGNKSRLGIFEQFGFCGSAAVIADTL
jgi:hypothetical protein